MATLYEILGVEKDATASELRRGYHRMSKRWHPDLPHGDRAKFEEADRAYKGLKDPAKRAFYDQNGSLPEEKPVPSENAEMYALIQRALQAVIQNGDSEYGDLVAAMTEMFKSEIRQMGVHIAEAEGKKKHLEKIQKRFKVIKTDSENVIAKIMQTQIDSLAGGICEGQRQRDNAEKAVQFLADYKYDAMESPKYRADQYFGASTA